MLRDVPPLSRRDSADESFFMNTPGVVTAADSTDMDGAEHAQHATTSDVLDDIFGSAPPSPALDAQNEDSLQQQQHRPEDPSDIPRLRSIHVTNGYREGIAVSKEEHVQAGFDEGYSLGGEVGLKAGWLLGALEGIAIAVAGSSASASNAQPEAVLYVRQMFTEAQVDLKVEKLLGAEFFGPEGIWLYEVPGQEGEGEIKVSFREVALSHPVLQRWQSLVNGLAERYGLHVQS